jgi:Flp pilus assembly protein TadD
MVEIDNILFGIALFEIFHDVQYLAIVWVFNRKRVDGDPNVGSFSRFLFRRSASMLGLYVGLVIGYGFVSSLQQSISIVPIQNILIAVVWTSTLLHFYFDGFIWKVRESGTQAGLGIAEGDTSQETRPLSDGQIHAAKWAPFFLAVAALALSQWFVAGLNETRALRSQRELQRYQHLVRVLPRYDHAHLSLGTRHYAEGDLNNAGKSFDRALEYSGQLNAKAHYNRGLVDAALKQLPSAIKRYQRSLELEPLSNQAHHVHFALGAAYYSLDDHAAAETQYLQALAINPRFAVAQLGLGRLYKDTGQRDKARRHLQTAVELLSEDSRGEDAQLRAARQELRSLGP